MLRSADPRANVHVFGPEATEPVRHRVFRDWLRTHPDDRDRYAAAKRAAAAGGGHVMEYNARKQAVLREILVRAIEASVP
ncbi:GrpB family protein [Aeromicrobium sp. LTX1]|uniref:GrpB family protein n=1 Tax=Aeromicrobium sp. LTX1 TaxID=3389798 RepID=UPI00396B272F